MEMNINICFDMDGTIADLYAVNDWLPKLRNFDPTPYMVAKVMHNMSQLARYLNKAQSLGYGLKIISWTSKESNPEYDMAIAQAKTEWLHKHLPSVEWDEIIITEYADPKEQYSNGNDILFDDNAEIRSAWENCGDNIAYEPNEIIEILRSLIATAEQ